MSKKEKAGTIGWIDLTVPNATEIRDFYKQVAGWQHTDISMGEYNDYCVSPPSDENPVAGICHKQGVNSAIPSQWLIYINVEDLDDSVTVCKSLGGKIIMEPKDMGQGKFCVIQDPAGAVAALFEPKE